MASDHSGVSRRRLLNFTVIAVAMLATGIGSTVASVAYASMAAHRQDAQQRTQDKTIAQLRRQLLASCDSTADLGSIPLPASPPPSRIAVKLITDNRAQWFANGCPGSLPVPPGLAAAATRYGIPVNGTKG